MASTNLTNRDRFSKLPLEILESIVRYVDKKNVLSAICRVSQLFHRITLPLLYESLEIVFPEDLDPQSAALEPFTTSWSPAEFASGVEHVRDLVLKSTLRDAVRGGSRCWHDADDDESENNDFFAHDVVDESSSSDVDDTDGPDEGEADQQLEYNSDEDEDYTDEPRKLSRHEAYFQRFCLGFWQDNLRSFRWEVGACVPHDLFSPGGFFTLHQTSLETLSFITDGTCDYAFGNRNTNDLSKFSMIRHFSWVGPQSFEDFRAIRQCFSANAGHLETLRLELADWETASDLNYRHTRSTGNPFEGLNFFMENVLGSVTAAGYPSTSGGISFPALERLTLGQVSFEVGSGILAESLNIFRLKHLTLRFCPMISRLLNHLADSNQALSLISCELSCCDEDADRTQEVQDAIIDFLPRVNGLEDLFLSLPSRFTSPGIIVEPLCRRLRSLKRIVLDSEAGILSLYDETRELAELGPYDFSNAVQFLFKNSASEMIAVNGDPTFMMGQFERQWSEIKCKLLHLRASRNVVIRRNRAGSSFRKDLDDFADGVFGPNSFDKLQVLAYGDFAFPESCGEHNVLYCRKDLDVSVVEGSNWELLTPANKKLWNWVHENMDFLAACPYRSIFGLV